MRSGRMGWMTACIRRLNPSAMAVLRTLGVKPIVERIRVTLRWVAVGIVTLAVPAAAVPLLIADVANRLQSVRAMME